MKITMKYLNLHLHFFFIFLEGRHPIAQIPLTYANLYEQGIRCYLGG